MFTDVQGSWPTHERFILVSCDEIYFNRYFPRFYKTFTKHWQLPIHAHLIDPSNESLKRLEKLGVSHTWCKTTDFDWAVPVNKLNATDRPFETVREWLYQCYCQCQRFVVMGSRIKEKQSVIVADVDAYAQHTPTQKQSDLLFSSTGFTKYKDKLMATFCHFHPRDIQHTRKLSSSMVEQLKDVMLLGTDQIVLKKIFGDIRDTTDLANNEWIRHYDVKQYKDEKAHRRCLVYHEKGVRGKNRTVDTTWKNMDKVPLSVARQGPPLK